MRQDPQVKPDPRDPQVSLEQQVKPASLEPPGLARREPPDRAEQQATPESLVRRAQRALQGRPGSREKLESPEPADRPEKQDQRERQD
ncbi:unnamed protein product [marine sediment metagenome]|uniref:Uncharacterized protein n=1 Tax=marine sediment metagenome TaxID=412755 RepID=X0T1I1_9ZZZZ